MLFDMLGKVDMESTLEPLLKARWEKGTEACQYSDERQFEVVKTIFQKYPSAQEQMTRSMRGVRYFKKNWLRYAAAAIIVLGIAIYFLEPGNVETSRMLKSKIVMAEKVIPGGNKAMLTLSDGTKIVLDSVGNGELIKQGGVSVKKSANGTIVYRADSLTAVQQLLLNTMTTPRGGKYMLSLPDGSGVWLNAASSITFPTLFSDNKREVSITGEVYFEVTKNIHKPFLVRINKTTQIEVLGTQFNINAYTDEATINATLLEGSIKITTERGANFLRPGQQAQVKLNGSTSLENDVEVQAVIAWKNDEFQFGEKANFPAIMRQISRWYDVDVEYKGNISGHLGGSISSKSDISMVLQMLEKASDMKFEIEGRKVIVTP